MQTGGGAIPVPPPVSVPACAAGEAGGTECRPHFSPPEDAMRTKLKLNVQQSAVDSFDTAASVGAA